MLSKTPDASEPLVGVPDDPAPGSDGDHPAGSCDGDPARLTWPIEESYRFFAESLPDLVWSSGPDGRVDYRNRRFLNYLGMTSEEMREVDWKDTLHHDDLGRSLRAWEDAYTTGGEYEVVYRIRRHDGVYRRHRCRATPMRDGSGRIARWFGTCVDIDDRKQAEEHQALQARVLESMTEGVSVSDEAGVIVYTNPAEDRIFGYDPGELVGKHVMVQNDYPPEENARIVAGVIETLMAEGSWSGEWRNRRKDGSPFWTFARITAVERAGRKLWVCVQEDITDRKAAEVALRASEERFARFMQHLPGVAWIKDVQGRYVYVNDAAERAFGTPCTDFYGRTDEEVFPPETAAQFRESDRRVLESGVGVQVAESQEHRDGIVHHSLVSKFPMPGPDGGPGLIGGMAIDISDRMRAEEAIRDSEGRFRHLADAMPQIVWVTRPDRSVEYVNRRWLDYTGQTPEQALGPGGWAAAIHPEDLGPILEASVRSHATGEPFEAEYRIRDASGAYRWHLGRAVGVFDEAGRLVRRFGAATDIDDRRRIERDARFLAEASAVLASIVDEAGTLQRVAHLAVPHFADWCSVDVAGEDGLPRRIAVAHRDPEKLELAHDLHRRYPPDPDGPNGVPRVLRTGQPEMVAEITHEMLAAGARDEGHLRILGELGLKSYICVPLRGRNGTLGAISFVAAESGRRYGPADLGMAEDLAARASIAIENARLYAELKEMDRRKDEFLATLAHELRNPLAPIRNALHLMRGTDGDGPLEAERAMAERNVVHLARLIDDLMDLARINRGRIELSKGVVDLGRVVIQAVETTAPLIDERRQALTVAMPEGAIRVEADPTRLEQVFWNLLNNAAKYTGPGGQIRLSAERDGGEVVVRVRDTGIGMTAEMLPRVFDMFVQVGEHRDHAQGGLGIGLSLVRTLVELHGGSVAARSDGPGHGSEFVVRLPALPPTRGEEATPTGRRGKPAGESPRRRILVVDDNVDAARSLARLLTRLYGQEVRVAHDGPEALNVAEEFRPEVVLLDIGLPGMDGNEVARQLRVRLEFETTLIVALTGWGQESDVERSREAGFDHHLVKPADPKAILALLTENGRVER